MKYHKAFTVTELLIAIFIISILLGIAVPNYHQHIIKTQRQEGIFALLDLSAQLEKYYVENNSYKDIPITTHNSANNLYELKIVEIEDNHYLISATPLGTQAENDFTCRSFLLDETGKRSISGSGSVQTCWGR